MAHQLRNVIALSITLAVFTGAGQSRRPFSHKYHLTQVAFCQTCHTDAEKSTKAEDNLLPLQEACARCHDEVHIKEPRPVLAHVFNHKLHFELGNPGPVIETALKNKTWLGKASDRPPAVNTKNACTACHHGIEESEDITEATGKALYPRMGDCLVCHSQIDPPESCKKCHVESAAFKFRPTNHTSNFLTSHVVKDPKLDKTDCSSCHGRKFTCKDCHH
jgi:hypothetical protein